MPVEKQIAIIYAGTNGYLDDLPIAQCRPFEKELYDYLEAQGDGGVLDQLRDKPKIDDELKAAFKTALTEFKTAFVARHKRGAAVS